MKFGSICFASLISSASSFNLYSSTAEYGVGLRKHHQLRSMAGEDADNAALFGGSVPGVPDKLPKAPPIDEENPMGGQMFRKLMERAKQGPSRPLGITGDQPSQSPSQPQYVAQQPQQPQQFNQPDPYGTTQNYGAVPQQPSMDPYSAYQVQLQAWQQQMTAFAQFSASNPQAAAQMTMPPPPPPPQAQPMQAMQQAPPQPQNLINVPSVEESEPKSAYDYLPKGDGRNSQAFEVNNASDVYLAQLKRDSTVRTIARKQGDIETANKPFADEGVKIIGSLLSDELIASRREQLKRSGGEFETSRDEMILPAHFIGDEELDKTYTGVSYKQKLMEAKKNKRGGEQTNVDATTAPVAEAVQSTAQFVPEVKPFSFDTTPTESKDTASATSSEEMESKPNFALQAKDESQIKEIAAPSMEDSEEDRKSVRTLMGLLLKHRGGPGFGHGRLEGAEAEKLENMSSEVLAMLQKESGVESTIDTQTAAQTSATSYATVPANESSSLLGAIACVDAALNMYKNASESGKNELKLPLRDALLSAVNTMNKVIAEENSNIEKSQSTKQSGPVYATTMDFPETYQVTQEEEEEAKEIANAIANGGESKINTERLQAVYDTLKAMTGNQKFGLRDVNQEEVRKLNSIGQLVHDDLHFTSCRLY